MATEFHAALEEARRRNSRGNRALLIGGAVVGAIAIGIVGAGATGGGVVVTLAAIVLGALAGVGVGALIARARNRRTAHLSASAAWAAGNGWQYSEKASLPPIDHGFLEQGDRRYAEDGATGTIAGHPAHLVNFTVEEDRTDGDGNHRTDRIEYFLVVIERPWQGPHLAITRRSITLGRGWRNALRSSATGDQAVELESDAFAKRFQVLLPDDWGKDVAFLLIPPDMQEQMAGDALLDDVLQVDATPSFIFLAWRDHFSAEDIPLLERRIADAGALAARWADDVPASMRPAPPPPAPPTLEG